MTLKQFARAAFYRSLNEYRQALESGQGIVTASLKVHAASGADGVTVAMRRMVGRTFRETRRTA